MIASGEILRVHVQDLICSEVEEPKQKFKKDIFARQNNNKIFTGK